MPEPIIQAKTVTSVIRLYFPLQTPSYFKFRSKAISRKGWSVDHMIDSGFYLSYIGRIFNKNGLNSDCLVLCKKLQNKNYLLPPYSFSVDHARIFSFDTSVALLELNILFSCDNPEDIANLVAVLRCCNHAKVCYGKDETVCVNTIAEQILEGLDPYILFNHIDSCGETRADLFISMIIPQSENDINLHAYRIANGLDSRCKEIPESGVNSFSLYPHVQWEISNRGICNTGIITSNERNNKFISQNWFPHSKHRYIIWYILALHQKYALYHFLNEIAKNNAVSSLKKTQEKIVFFNTKYRFSIISEETSYQKPYEMFCEILGLEKQFADIDDEIERISEYHEAISNKNNTKSMTIISILCAIATLKEFYDLVKETDSMESIFNSFLSLSSGGKFMYVFFLLSMIISIIILIPKNNIIKWFKNSIQKFLNLIFQKRL